MSRDPIMSRIDDLDGILYDSMRQLNTSSLQTVNSIVHRLEAYVEVIADFIRDIDAQDLTQDANFSDQCRELQAVVVHLLVLWQTKLLQLDGLTSHERGRRRAYINVEMVSSAQ